MQSITATSQEIRAAIDGTLQMRRTKGTAAQPNLKTQNRNGHSIGHPIGMTTGLPILLAWCYIFQKNETLKLTDKELSDWIKAEFPDRRTAAFDHPASVRGNYNRGQFTRGMPPQIKSRRHG